VFIWGAGQDYNEERGKALVFQLMLIALIVGSVLAVIFREELFLFLASHGISASETFLSVELLFFCILTFWLAAAGNAYHRAARSRANPFRGIDHRVYPCLCSLLLPGWGQFLNGQPIKGSIFSAVSLFGIFAIVSIPATLLFWPTLEASEARLIVDAIFTITVLYAPLIPFVWLLSAHDALKVSLDELLKESLWERIRSANNRRRTQGWVRGVFPQIQWTILLVLVLAILSFVVSRAFPAAFYTDLLRSASAYFGRLGMIILPEIIEKLVPVVAQAGA
jgi:TM2 domain-containing membrane protein YozV